MSSRRSSFLSPAVEELERRILLAAVPLPDPAIVMYGHHDGSGVTDAFQEIIPPFNIIEGTSTNASFIKELRNQGRVYAAHVTNPSNETATQLLARWRAPLENTLGGQLPGGYDAIAIDELHGADTNGTTHSNAVVSALGQLRALYPSKGIYAATTWHYGHRSADYSDQLRALNSYSDLIFVENYMREGNYSSNHFSRYADNLKAAAPGILSKAIYGLYISQGGFVADDSTDMGFWGLLDDQFYRIRNDTDAASMPGVMFWVYYRSQQDLTPDYVAQLVDHYYTQNNTHYFGNGNYSQLVSNPQFEGNTAGWSLTPGTGGSIQQFNYSSTSLENDHDSHAQASHGSQGLRTVRGSTHNEASFQVSGIDTGLVYTVSAWVISDSPGSRARVEITEPDGTLIEARQVNDVGSPPNYVTKWNEWTRITFNFVPTSNTLRIVLSDKPASQGTRLYWDFVELEDAFPTEPVTTNRPPTIPGSLVSANLQTDRATVSWGKSTDADGDDIDYEIQSRKDGLSSSWSSTLTTGNLSYTLTGLQADTSYHVRVRAFDGQLRSAWRTVDNLFTTTLDNQPPTSPGTLSAMFVSGTTAMVRWETSTDPNGDSLAYQVEYRKVDLSDSWTRTVFSTALGQPLSGLQQGTSYSVRVRAFDGTLYSDWRESTNLFTTLGVTVAGDMNDDGVVDADDIDLVQSAVRTGSTDLKFDLDSNHLINSADVSYLVETILNTRFGDLDTDGDVDTIDLTVRIINFTGANGSGKGWREGDLDGDTDIDTADLTRAIINFTGAAARLSAPLPLDLPGSGRSADTPRTQARLIAEIADWFRFPGDNLQRPGLKSILGVTRIL